MMRHAIQRFVADDDGQDIVEYALLLFLVVLVSIATWDAIEAAFGVSYGCTSDGKCQYDSQLWTLFGKAPGS